MLPACGSWPSPQLASMLTLNLAIKYARSMRAVVFPVLAACVPRHLHSEMHMIFTFSASLRWVVISGVVSLH